MWNGPKAWLWKAHMGPDMWILIYIEKPKFNLSDSRWTSLIDISILSILDGTNTATYHDDFMKCTCFLRYWPFGRGIHLSSVDFTHKGQWCRAVMFSLMCTWTNGWTYKLPLIWFVIRTWSNVNIFCTTGPLWGESTSHQWIPPTETSDMEVWYFLWCTPELTRTNNWSSQSSERPWCKIFKFIIFKIYVLELTFQMFICWVQSNLRIGFGKFHYLTIISIA